jgi:hypothetical protein
MARLIPCFHSRSQNATQELEKLEQAFDRVKRQLFSQLHDRLREKLGLTAQPSSGGSSGTAGASNGSNSSSGAAGASPTAAAGADQAAPAAVLTASEASAAAALAKSSQGAATGS